jgi:hypothetical protein
MQGKLFNLALWLSASMIAGSFASRLFAASASARASDER